jgi:histidinol phosphatase-like enzyme
MVARYGRLLGPEEMRAAAKTDPGVFPPAVQFRMKRETERPTEAEGFSRVDVVPFVRRREAARTGRGLLVWLEGVVVGSRSGRRAPSSPDDALVLPGRARVLRRYADDGYRLVALSWRPDVALGAVRREELDSVHERIAAELGLEIDFLYCPHPAGPPVCWCRKPLPGLGVVALQRHGLDAAASFYVGAGPQEAGFARRLGLAHREAAELFADEP